MLDAFLPLFKRHLTYIKHLRCLDIEWDEDKNAIVQNLNSSRQWTVLLWTTVHGLYIIFQLATLLIGRHTLADKFLGGLILSAYSISLFLRMDFDPDFLSMHRINRLTSGQDLAPPLSNSLLVVFQTMCVLFELTYWIFALGMALMAVFTPCKPPLLGSFLLCGASKSSSFLGWAGKWFLVGLEFAFAMQIVVVGVYFGIYCQFPGLMTLWGRCLEFLKSTRDNGQSDMSIVVDGYRRLQIVERMQNFSCRGRLMLVCIMGIPPIEILSGVAFVTSSHSNSANLFQVPLFFAAYIDVTLFAMLLLTAASSIYVRTEDWIKNARKWNSGGKSKIQKAYFRRVHRSFRPLRLEFGSNFVDRLTPLVMQEFCNRQTAAVLLTMRNKA